MDENEQPSFSLTGFLRRIAETLFRTLQNRVELFALEFEEEKHWMVATMLWAGAAMFFCGLAAVFVAVTVVWVAPEAARPWWLAGFSILFLFLAVSAVAGFRRVLREKPPAFSETLSELKKDIEWTRSRD
jgi:uncharacterized membrane protein YqjE